MKRRHLIASMASMPFDAPAASGPGSVLILRHAHTEPGIGDPPGYVLGRCETQRNLSAEGRAQAAAFGRTLVARDARPAAILSSRWCRCVDTAVGIARAFGASAPAVEPWPELDSFFDVREREPAQTAALRERLRERRTTVGFELWVTHQVNISALTGVLPAMGEALWLQSAADGRVQALRFAA